LGRRDNMCNTTENINILRRHGLKVEQNKDVIIVNGKPVYDYVFEFYDPKTAEIVEFITDVRKIKIEGVESCQNTC